MNSLRHVAIIMDGNNRWAKQQGKKGIAGHKAGVERIRDVLAASRKCGVEALTLFAFSSENWKRPPKEVEALMGLFYNYLKKEAKKLADDGVRLKVIGSRERFSAKLYDAILEAESMTHKAGNHFESTLVIAADYGGKWDIAHAAKQLALQVQSGDLNPSDITEHSLDPFMSTAGLPSLDLLIRTGGEHRISNYLLWQAAYAELYFSPLLWPDFDGDAMSVAADNFFARQRRFGKTSEQIEAAQGVQGA